MIDNQLIDNAKRIRQEYLMLMESLGKYEKDIRDLSKFLLDTTEDLKKYNKTIVSKIKSKQDISEVVKYLVSKIGEIETEEIKLTYKVQDVNKKIEQLNKDEETLYLTIKSRYPNLSDDNIKKEVQSHLER